MGIQSLGVGSGLALDDLVSQLLEAERKPKQDRLDKREEQIDATLSGLGKLKSKLSEFKDSVDELRDEYKLKKRSTILDHPSDSVEPFSAESANSATPGTYKVAITGLASGSRVETADAVDGGFSSKSDKVLTSGSGSLTFKIGATGDSFQVNVTTNMTLEQLRNAVNNASGNFGVNASIIDTGTADGGAKLVFSSTVTGTGNDLEIVNDNDLAELQRVSTVDSTETTNYLTPVKSAQNATAEIDGIKVESSTNEFENTIGNVTFEAKELSSKDALGDFQTSTLEVGFDKEAIEKKIRDFMDNYNALTKEIGTLTRYGESELEKDGELAGDFMVRSIQAGMSKILSSAVDSSALGSLYQLGLSLNEDGELEITETAEFGLDSGVDRLNDALDDNFDEIAKLFADPDQGIADQLYSYIKEYTSFGGLLPGREQSVKQEKDSLADQRERLELQMLSYEDYLRKRYINLDKTVAQLNQTGNALMASLSAL